MNLLAVDDEALALKDLQKAIQTALPGSVPACFDSPEKALEYVRSHPVDVAFLDVSMPEMDGLALAGAIKEIQPFTNIIFVTGYMEYAGEAFGLHASGYLLKPVEPGRIQAELDDLRHPIDPAAGYRIRIQCFGNFEVFVDGEPVKFTRDKSKEALAYLVDRRGASVSTAELCAALWEDKAYSRSYTSVILCSLIQDLKRAQIGDLLLRQWNRTAVNTALFWCDSYAFEKGETVAVNSYRGEYMAQYSWAERFNASYWNSEFRQRKRKP